MSRAQSFPVIDVFAGPGGLSEGFSAFRRNGAAPFRVVLSIEKDPIACRTLQLRKFLRKFPQPPDEYTALTRGELSVGDLYAAYPKQAKAAADQAWRAELGVESDSLVSQRVGNAIGGTNTPWVMVGGPPCQAYSLVGRSRMRSTKPDFEADERHVLYREYLRIVARHQPAVFVMENVRGILSSTHSGSRIFSRIIDDLRRPRVRDADDLDERLFDQQLQRLFGLLRDQLAHLVVAAAAVDQDQRTAQPGREPMDARLDL